ncbi:hypothetical protein IOCL1545_000091400 [Leishmania shawi]|uniref:Uncharacterized protein n=1 Tax=Leishmania shawi TaxID=5680 RepID=A0ABR3EFK3_9TRYP
MPRGSWRSTSTAARTAATSTTTFLDCIDGGLSVAVAVSAGPCWNAWLTVPNTATILLPNTWKTYYRDALVLPVIDSPSEGITITIRIYLRTA